MLRRLFFIPALFCLLVFIGIAAAQETQEPNVPHEIVLALESLNQDQDRSFELNDLEAFRFEEFIDADEWTCSPGIRISASERAPYYAIVFEWKARGGNLIVDSYYVGRGGSYVAHCGSAEYQATATPTVDLTRTTATPSRTPTLTFTPSNTFTPRPTLTSSPTFTSTNTFTPTFTLTPSFTATPTNTPTITMTPRPDSVTCPGFLTSRLVAGEQARVLLGGDPNRLRDNASTSGAQLAIIAPGDTFDVLEGPSCDSAGRAWWRVSYRGFIGWTVEGQGDDYFTEPLIGSQAEVRVTFTPTQTLTPSRTPRGSRETAVPTAVTCAGFMPSRLLVGAQGRVTPGDPNNMRDAHSTSGALVGQIPGGEIFTVLEGPYCDSQGRAWWHVEYNGVSGWTVEGQGDTYYVEPVG